MPGMGDNIRRAGADFNAGDPVFEKGRVLDSGHILVLATLGIGKVKVLKRPEAALISTGREIVDEPGAKLDPGQIYNSTRPYLSAALAASGANVREYGTVPDNPDLFREKLSAAMKDGADIVISTGAVSAGVHDFIPEALKDAGSEILFHKVAIRPGKPVLFAKLPGGAFFFGLPGNPVSSAVGLRFFVQPFIRALQGLPPEQPRRAVLKSCYSKGKSNLRFFVRGKLREAGNAACEIEIPHNQQSFRVRPFIDTNVWVSVPDDIAALEEGSVVEIYQ